jgi:HK97 family phage prohead protease
MERRQSWSVLTIKATAEDVDTGHLEGLATTPTTDRVGDIVEPKGASFALPLPLLWQHDSGMPIGQVTGLTVADTGITIKATVSLVTRRIQDQWALIKAGLVRGLSIGFRPLESEPVDGKSVWNGERFTKWEFLELSAVTIPANAEASILAVKHFDRNAPGATGSDRTSQRRIDQAARALATLKSLNARNRARRL